jgi:hypothetical protein
MVGRFARAAATSAAPAGCGDVVRDVMIRIATMLQWETAMIVLVRNLIGTTGEYFPHPQTAINTANSVIFIYS